MVEMNGDFVKRTFILIACFVLLAYLMNILTVYESEKYEGGASPKNSNVVQNERFVGAGAGGCPYHQNCPFGGQCPYAGNVM